MEDFIQGTLQWQEYEFLKEFYKLSETEKTKYMAWILFRQDLMINFSIDIPKYLLFEKNDIYCTNFYNENCSKIMKLSDKLYWYFYKLNKKEHVDVRYERRAELQELGEQIEHPVFDYPNYFNDWKVIGGLI